MHLKLSTEVNIYVLQIQYNIIKNHIKTIKNTLQQKNNVCLKNQSNYFLILVSVILIRM